MNELNVASLEASKRLVGNGIVLSEVDFMWFEHEVGEWILMSSDSVSIKAFKDGHAYPAPCFTEVLLELPLKESPSGYAHLVFYSTGISWVTNTDESFFAFGSKFNPTDALIELLIWVRKEKK